ncbi:MAG: NAD(P)H-hydrate dehydratase [Lachnospiraceae bacterium]|nr:NAD(P)H-hydrate dehydratase [Lachnospiraceae bacterium]
MEVVLDGRQAKELDRYAIEEFGMQSLLLMERAAYEVAACIRQLLADRRRVFIMAGTGNNGADGLAAARMLTQSGYEVEILLAGKEEKATREWKYQRMLIDRLKIRVTEWQEETVIPNDFDVYVDALFGIGLTREIGGNFKRLIEAFMKAAKPDRAKQAVVVAVDICSGICSTTGAVLGTAVKADLTVTFGYRKNGHVLYPGACCCGEVKVFDIGFDPKGLPDCGDLFQIPEKSDIRRWLGEREPSGNKGTFGKVLVIAGAAGMAGAACFAAEAAYRMGAGLVTVLTAPVNRPILQMKLPEAVILNAEAEWEQTKEQTVQAIRQAKAIVVGPGLSMSREAERILELVLDERGQTPVVIDADGLNLLAQKGKQMLDQRVILTPHPGELARLLDCPVCDLKAMGGKEASRLLFDKFGAVSVCKDARTVVRTNESEVFLNLTGNDGMATGGSGDVLAGMIGGLLAMGIEPQQAAPLGVWLHGAAGNEAAEKKGRHSLLARDLLAAIPAVMKSCQ